MVACLTMSVIVWSCAVPDMIEKVMPSLSKSAIDFHSGLIFGLALLKTKEIWYCHGAIE